MHFNPGVLFRSGQTILRSTLNWAIGKVLYRLRFDVNVTEAYTFHNYRHRPDEYLAYIEVLIQNHNDHPMLISNAELCLGDVQLTPTTSLYIYENNPWDSVTVLPSLLRSTSFPERVEAHAPKHLRLYFDVGTLDIPNATLEIIVGTYRRKVAVKLQPRQKA